MDPLRSVEERFSARTCRLAVVFDLGCGSSYHGLTETEASHGYDPAQAGA